MLRIAILATSIFVTSVGVTQSIPYLEDYNRPLPKLDNIDLTLLTPDKKFNILPTTDEKLKTPVKLNCGNAKIFIVENRIVVNNQLRSQELFKDDIDNLNKLCTIVINQYNQSHIITNTSYFTLNISFIPDSNLPRCLNDKNGRFKSAKRTDNIDGWTNKNPRHSFIISEHKDLLYIHKVFAHELFHALNFFYNISDTESDAEDFTEKLGYGR